MYAVIATGGKQYRVEEGQRLEVERLGADAGSDVELSPVLLVDGEKVLATPDQLGAVKVTARVVDPNVKGTKIRGFTYKPKTNNRKRWGHRQGYALVEITGISAGGAPAKKAPAAEKAPAARKAPAKKAPAAKKAQAKKAPAKKAPAKKASS